MNQLNKDHQQPFTNSGFSLALTADGSPTLALNTQESTESMHHSGGAASETWYIYGNILKSCLSTTLDQPLQVACVGLGLGYVEMTWALNCLKQNKKSEIDSFEIVPGLIESFRKWFKKEVGETIATYNLALKKLVAVKNEFWEVENQVKDFLSQQDQNNFRIHSDILNFTETKKWHVICFDAFSKKSSATLWTEEFLNSFLENHTQADCVFTTYACTSQLKRVLKNHDFNLINRPGFSGKRESTLAVRGSLFLTDYSE